MHSPLDSWILSLRRHPLVALVAFVAVVAITAAVVIFAPRKYRSEAKVLLRIGRETVTLDPTARAAGDTLSLHHTRENEIRSALGVMESRAVLERVVDEMGVGVILSGRPPGEMPDESGWIGRTIDNARSWVTELDPVPPRETAINELAESLSIYAPADSSVVSIEYESRSPEVARDVVEAWVRQYVRHHSEVHRTRGGLEFFVEQNATLAEELDQARAKLESAKTEIGLVTVAGQQNLIESQLLKVQEAITEVDAEIAATTARADAIDKLLRDEVQPTVTAAVIDKPSESQERMRNQLFELEMKEKELRSKLRDDHPKLVSAREQLGQAREVFQSQSASGKEITEAVNPSHQTLADARRTDRARREGLLEQRRSLERRRFDLLVEAKHLNGHERTLAALTEQVNILETRYAEHSRRMEEARMDEVLAEQQITSIAVVQDPTMQFDPTTPNKSLCVAFGSLAAIAAALSIPVLIDVRRASREPKYDHDQWRYESAESPAEVSTV